MWQGEEEEIRVMGRGQILPPRACVKERESILQSLAQCSLKHRFDVNVNFGERGWKSSRPTACKPGQKSQGANVAGHQLPSKLWISSPGAPLALPDYTGSISSRLRCSDAAADI